MDSKEFISNAIRTESVQDGLVLSKGGTYKALLVFVMAAHVADTIKRGIYYGKPLDKEKLLSQLSQLELFASDLRMRVTNLDRPEDYPVAGLQEPNLRLLHGAIGIFSESGEMLEALIAEMTLGELDLVNFGEETGDIDWYKAIIHDATGVDETTTREAVIAKLKARYGDKFSSDAATSRDLAVERAVLESTLAVEGN